LLNSYVLILIELVDYVVDRLILLLYNFLCFFYSSSSEIELSSSSLGAGNMLKSSLSVFLNTYWSSPCCKYSGVLFLVMYKKMQWIMRFIRGKQKAIAHDLTESKDKIGYTGTPFTFVTVKFTKP